MSSIKDQGKHSTAWKREKFALTETYFRQITVFSKNVAFTKILSNKCEITLFCTEKSKVYSQRKIFRQIIYLEISSVNALVSRNFCQTRVRVFLIRNL